MSVRSSLVCDTSPVLLTGGGNFEKSIFGECTTDSGLYGLEQRIGTAQQRL